MPRTIIVPIRTSRTAACNSSRGILIPSREPLEFWQTGMYNGLHRLQTQIENRLLHQMHAHLHPQTCVVGCRSDLQRCDDRNEVPIYLQDDPTRSAIRTTCLGDPEVTSHPIQQQVAIFPSSLHYIPDNPLACST